MLLSPHFHLSQFTLSQTAARMGRQIVAGPEIVAALDALCDAILEPVWEHFGDVHISSGYRPDWLNRVLSGTANHSQHMEGRAADFTCPGHSVEEVTRWLGDSELPFDQLIYEFAAWTHVSFDDARNRKEVLTARHPGTQGQPTIYLPGIQI
ncbi:MAG: DUF882 domain-containing protein [Patescibacteria group bacterium]|nr:DUF882 domain-containing protein [Patescibacteria group bacterium]